MTATAEPEDAAPLTGEEHTPGFLGHPRGLWYLAFTEAWERFSYYGMQSLLVLYMVKYLLLPGRIERVAIFDAFRQLPLYRGLDGQPLASAIFGTYTASVYLTPIFGGFLADRVLGRRRTVLLGALTMAAGHFLMAYETAFLFALILLIPVIACALIPNQQIFNAYLVWGDQQFDLVFRGNKLPTTWLVTLDAIVSVSFLAGVALFYRWYGKHWREPDEITKIIIGSVFNIAGQLCLYMAAASHGAEA